MKLDQKICKRLGILHPTNYIWGWDKMRKQKTKLSDEQLNIWLLNNIVSFKVRNPQGFIDITYFDSDLCFHKDSIKDWNPCKNYLHIVICEKRIIDLGLYDKYFTNLMHGAYGAIEANDLYDAISAKPRICAEALKKTWEER